MDLRVNDWAWTCQRVYLSPWPTPSAITLTLGTKAEMYCVCMCRSGGGVGGEYVLCLGGGRRPAELYTQRHIHVCIHIPHTCRCADVRRSTHLFFPSLMQWNVTETVESGCRELRTPSSTREAQRGITGNKHTDLCSVDHLPATVRRGSQNFQVWVRFAQEILTQVNVNFY